jgi:hypothetical protein
MVCQVCEPHLPDVAQPLHFRRINQVHQGVIFGRIFVEGDQVVNGITVEFISNQLRSLAGVPV